MVLVTSDGKMEKRNPSPPSQYYTQHFTQLGPCEIHISGQTKSNTREYAEETFYKTISRRPMVNFQSHTINIPPIPVLPASHCKDKLVMVLWKDGVFYSDKWIS